MTPDELDRWCAEKVMGWEFFECGYFGTEEETPRMTELEEWMEKVGLDSVGNYYIKPEQDFFSHANDWHPSDPATGQIWQVVEKMRELGFDISIGPYYKSKERFHAQVTPFINYDVKIFYEAVDDNPCLAILKAAKAALEGMP